MPTLSAGRQAKPKVVSRKPSYWEHYAKSPCQGIRGLGSTQESAFEQAACALTAKITDLATIEPRYEIKISCQAPEKELLLADWLNATVYEMLVHHMVFCEFEVQLHGDCLNAVVRGERLDYTKHHPALRVKGVNYFDLACYQNNKGLWVAQCSLDTEEAVQAPPPQDNLPAVNWY